MFAIWTLNPSRILQKLWSPIRTPNPSWSPPSLYSSIVIFEIFSSYKHLWTPFPDFFPPIVRLNTFPGKFFLFKKITLFLHYFLLSILKEHTASLSFRDGAMTALDRDCSSDSSDSNNYSDSSDSNDSNDSSDSSDYSDSSDSSDSSAGLVTLVQV